MEWNQPPRKKIFPESVGEMSSTKECCAVDWEEKEEEDSEVLVPVVCRRELDVPPHGGVSGSAPTWYPLGTRTGKPNGMQQLWPWSSNLVGQKLSAKTDLSFW